MSNKSGYKTTEVGEIPEEWEVVKLEDNRLAKKLQAGGTPLRSIKEYYGNGKIPFVRIEDMTMNEHYLYDTQIKITEKGLENSSAWLVPPNTILFSMYASYGEVVINKIPVATNQAIIAIMPQENVDIEYLYYSFRQLKSKLYRHLRETTQKNLNAEIVRNLKIPLPPFPEQRKIASVLCCVDGAIRTTDEIIQRTRELKKGLMQQLLTKGIGHTKFKQTEIGEIPEEWEVAGLADCLSICQYGLSIPLFNEGKYPILRMNNFDNGYVAPSDIKYANIDEGLFNQFKLEHGDILFNRTNSYDLVGKIGIFLLKGDYTFASYLIRLRTNSEKLDPHFINYYLNTTFMQSKLKSMATRGVSQSNINAKNLKSLKVPVPPLLEQRKISSVLFSMDEKTEKERHRKERLEKLKKGLMQDLLTGRVRVKVN